MAMGESTRRSCHYRVTLVEKLLVTVTSDDLRSSVRHSPMSRIQLYAAVHPSRQPCSVLNEAGHI